jgi:V-type H+-transporting ATPase subunit a
MTKCQFYLTMTAIEGWVPTVYLPDLRYHVRRATEGTGHPPAVVDVEPHNTVKQPKPDRKPTYFETDKYTAVFQGIVDTYGIARYQEVNPGLFTIVTFPFLFGVMYGDIGHGCILTICSFLMIWYEGKIKESVKKGAFLGEVGAMAYQGRYCLFLMGLFAIYCGTIYNDCMSIPLSIYRTAYPTYWQPSNDTKNYIWDGSVPAYGADWRWSHSVNQLAFFNSFKMKVAVSLGVIHMTFGIFLGLANNLFLPKIIFMTCTFGYMIFMIWFKWCTNWNYDGAKPPNLIQVGSTTIVIHLYSRPF